MKVLHNFIKKLHDSHVFEKSLRSDNVPEYLPEMISVNTVSNCQRERPWLVKYAPEKNFPEINAVLL